MNLLHVPIPPWWAAAGWMLLLPPVLMSLRSIRAVSPMQGAQQHLWLAGIVVLALLWTLQARASGGAAFCLLGAALCALVFGRHWARLGLIAAVVLHVGLGDGRWANIGLGGLLLAVVPTALTGAMQTQIERRLPRNLFVFIIGNGLFVTLSATAATSVLLVAVGWLLGAQTYPADHFAYALLLAWGEALASGMLFSALVIFGPNLVLTYHRDVYLPPWRGL